MRTGYTAPVADGDVTEFSDFAMECARAFGDLVELRDSPHAEIPEEFKPSDYHQRHLDGAKDTLESVQAWTAEEATVLARDAHREAVERAKEMSDADALKRERYEAMLAKVEAWTPPTPDHDELKKFMVQQLEESIRFDCGHEWTALPEQTGEEFKAAKIAQALHDIEYHSKHLAEDYERARTRTLWVRALRESLGRGEGDRMTYWNGTDMTDEPREIVLLAIDDACVGADAEGLERAADRVLDHLAEAGWGIYRKELVDKADAAWTLQQVRSGGAVVNLQTSGREGQ